MAKRAAAGTLALAVCLSGGAVALAGAANATSGFKFNDAVAGVDRYETAAMISHKAFPNAGDAKAIVLANGWSSVDGLSASYVAGVKSAPVLFTDSSSVPASTQAEMARLGVKDVYIVGGTTVVSAKIETWLSANGYTLKNRFGGATRYDTSAQAADAGDTAPTKVLLASGDKGHNADALVVSPIAYKNHYPVLLTTGTSASSETKAELAKLGTKTVVTVGGTTVISESTATSFGSTSRLYGDDRQGTATKVADWAISEGFSKTDIGLVSGANGHEADALASASLAAKSKSPLLYTNFSGGSSATTEAYLTAHAADLTTGWAFGGTDVVSPGAISAATKAAASVSVTNNQSFVVTSTTTGSNTFKFADSSANKEVTVTYSDGDNFLVDGTKATVSVFESEITQGDLITVTPAADSSSKLTYSLTTKALTDYTSGLIGAVSVGSTFTIYEPISSTALNTVTYTGTYTIYTVDGASVSATAFGQALNIGDTVKVTGTGADAEHIRTVALTNQSIGGTVTGKDGNNFSVKTASGTVLGIYTAGVSDKLTVDGTSKDQSGFNAALTNGDTVTVSKAGDVQTLVLVNAAPASVTGQASVVSGAMKTRNAQDGALLTVGYVTADGPKTITLGAALGTPVAVQAASTVKETSAISLGSNFPTTDYRSKLSFKYGTASTSSVATGTVVTVDLPRQGTMSAADYAVAVAGAIQAKVRAIPASSGDANVTGATVTVDSTTWVATIQYGTANAAATDIASASTYDAPRIFVDGSVATASEAWDALTLADVVKYQAPDLATSTTSKLDITNASLQGVVKAWSTPNITVYAAGSSTNALSTVAYNDGTALGLPATATYTVNGAVKEDVDFSASLDAIQSGTLKGSIKITQSGTKTLYALTTSLA